MRIQQAKQNSQHRQHRWQRRKTMSDIFLRSDAALDAAISECTDPERIRELTKAHLAATGIISRERGNDWGARVIGSQPSESAPAVALPANVVQDTCVRTIYPSG